MADRGGNQQNRGEQGRKQGGGQVQGQPNDGAAGQQPGAVGGAQSRQEGIVDVATKPRTKEYLTFFVGLFAVVGLAVGLSVILVGALGGSPLSPDFDSTVQNQLDSNVDNVDEMLAQMHLNRLAATAINGAPLLAAVLGVVTGGYVGSRLRAPDREAYVTAGLSAGVGSAVLVTLVGFLASTQIDPVPAPELTDEASQSAGMAEAGLGAVEGIPSAILIGGTDLSTGDLLTNAVLIGIAVGAVAAATVYVVRNYSPPEA
ncbi:hypothetical protein [Halostella sp. PRR32]|uniref:hypothetical protein n=1 Tax=Halostella sp. PRR32 TaxID=3098147 RepID=UPI00110E94C2|nr:hypothetical protein [Halostella sp. PRR32]